MKVVKSLICGCWLATVPEGAAMSWEAQPIYVHEWGVNGYNWSEQGQQKPKFPPHIYTPEKPGVPFSHPVVKQGKEVYPARVKDMTPDSGIRYKPVLYFYPPWGDREFSKDGKIATKRIYGSAPVAVEMRFKYGHACAWYPQVSVFRDTETTAGASAPNWDAWRQKNGIVPFRGYSGKGVHRTYLMGIGKTVTVPDDLRFELVWDRLTLNPRQPGSRPAHGLGSWEQQEIEVNYPGQGLPVDHWTKVAREVDAVVVSNGKETEKYLFYEGITREQPAVTLVRGGTMLVNVSKHPVYDVYMIYNHGGKRYVKYHPVLQPLPDKVMKRHLGGASPHPMMTLPKWGDWQIYPKRGDDNQSHAASLDEEQFRRATSDRLIRNMTEGEEFRFYERMRDPADPQRPSQSHKLYPKEASVVERIWRDEFFNQPGLTILYRESPSYLDEAMPLNIYTDMYHYIKLNRCGWVVNHQVDPDKAKEVEEKTRWIGYVKKGSKQEQELADYLKKNKLYARGILQFDIWVFNSALSKEWLRRLEEKAGVN